LQELAGEQIEALSKALSKAMNENTLERAVYSSTGDRLYKEYVGKGKPLRPTIESLLISLEERGITLHFLLYVYRNWKNNSRLRTAIAEMVPEAAGEFDGAAAALSIQRGGVIQPDSPPTANAPGFQSNVRPNLQQLDVRAWYHEYLKIESCVCRIEQDGAPLGTGFLVGPQAVLTNWHVVETAKAANNLDRIGCRFDYVRLASGARKDGLTVLLANNDGDHGLVDYSPYGENEGRNIHIPPPKPDELDFALLRLERAVGDEENRGWIPLPASLSKPPVGDPVQIVQHPDGASMKLVIDTNAVLKTDDNTPRIRYTTNTEPGSSGSPCLTMDWRLFGLHHYGDPEWLEPKFNQGIPAALVRDMISKEQGGALLGS